MSPIFPQSSMFPYDNFTLVTSSCDCTFLGHCSEAPHGVFQPGSWAPLKCWSIWGFVLNEYPQVGHTKDKFWCVFWCSNIFRLVVNLFLQLVHGIKSFLVWVLICSVNRPENWNNLVHVTNKSVFCMTTFMLVKCILFLEILWAVLTFKSVIRMFVSNVGIHQFLLAECNFFTDETLQNTHPRFRPLNSFCNRLDRANDFLLCTGLITSLSRFSLWCRGPRWRLRFLWV